MMSNLQQLINSLCPDGVEYKKLGDIATIIRGNGLQKTDFTESGIGCIHYGQIYTYYGTFAYKTKSFVSAEIADRLKKVNKGDLIIAVTSENVEDVCKCVAWLGDDEIVTGGHSAIIKHEQNPKYLSYYFQSAMFFAQKRKIAIGTKVIEVAPKKLENILIPVPPLNIQDEIVRILDKMSAVENESKSLCTQLKDIKRSKFEYYKDKLLTFGDDVEYMSFGKSCFLKAGKNITAVNISKVKDDEYIYPCYGGNGIRGYVKEKSHTGNYPIIGRQGALCGNVCYAENEFYATEHAVVVSDNGYYNSKFLYYLLQAADLNQYKTAGAQPGLSVARLEKIVLPIPSLAEQERIVAILDRFTATYNELMDKVTEAIQIKEKRYKYYRDTLLTFKQLVNTGENQIGVN